MNMLFKSGVLGVISLLSLLPSFADSPLLRFVYCSDLHYGIQRTFRGVRADAETVNCEMFKAFSLLPETSLPADGGVEAGKKFGKPDFFICTGDIANRMQKGAWSASRSWNTFRANWDSLVQAKLYLVPGNHDISNAIGHPKGLDSSHDAGSAAGIFNYSMQPSIARTASSFWYQTDKVHYTFTTKGIRFAFIGMWPDQIMRSWLKKEFKSDRLTPTFIFTHDPVEAESKHFQNPHPPYDINARDKFENLLADTALVKSTQEKPEANWKVLTEFFKKHPQIKAYFHGDFNYNEFYDWTGTDSTLSLPVFRVDSPMKGELSGKDETRLSFIVVTIDTSQRLLTARECLWNTTGKTAIEWGESRTISY